MSSAHARAVRPKSQPISTGSPESPYPGREGSTRWKASSAPPPCAAGSVKGPTESISSITEPGQPWVMIRGRAFSCDDLTWMKWTSTPSISVTNCGSAFRRASIRPKSYSSSQYRASVCSVSSWTPCDRSPTSSLLGQRVAPMRRRSSSSFSAGISMWKGRISVDACTAVLMASPLVGGGGGGTRPQLAPPSSRMASENESGAS